jgi:hypothetical protein
MMHIMLSVESKSLIHVSFCGKQMSKMLNMSFNYDFPGSLEDYVHRISRTGRAGAKGTAYSFFTAANARFAKELINILEEAGQKVSPELAAMGRGAPPPSTGKFATGPLISLVLL